LLSSLKKLYIRDRKILNIRLPKKTMSKIKIGDVWFGGIFMIVLLDFSSDPLNTSKLLRL
tara:strand:+ start:388 stop:567 length:180 start_codon:yes stop_codon:yes gene_type:complete